jgi:dTDP-glucose 4,6-dehydratase/UDP-glucuronate decarboxylase
MPELIALIDEDAARVVDAVDLSPLDDRSILITGASGLVGLSMLASLRERMRRTGRPIAVTAVTHSRPPPEFAPFFEGEHFRLVQCDLADAVAVRALPGADCIVHAAGYGQPGKFLENPAKTILLNTMATAALLEKTSADGRFLFVSSSEIYSGSPRSPHREDDIGTTDPGHRRACYIEGKRCGEAICHAFAGTGRTAKIARLALAYGPGTRTDDQRVLNSLIRKALLDGRIALLDQGAARRTYGYLTDAVEMLFSILLHGKQTVYNVGGRSRTTILELAQAVGAIIEVPVSVPEQVAGLSGAPDDVSLDLGRYCDEFAKTDFVPLDTGLRRTIAWQRHLYGRG